MLQRSLVVLLSTLNLGAAAWWALHPPVQPVVEPVRLGIARLELLSEARRDAATASASPRTRAGRPTQCHSYGPFQDDQAMVAAQARLQGVALWMEIRREPLGPPQQWRVLLPPLESVSHAAAATRRMAAAGISDYRVIERGPETNAIAVGMFSSVEAARSRVQALQAVGFAARIEPWGPNMGAWLDVAGADDFDPVRAQVLAGASKRKKIDCAALR